MIPVTPRPLRAFAAHCLLGALLASPWSPAARADTFTLEDATLADIQEAMAAGALTSVELVSLYLNRINVYDRNGIFINSTPLLNPTLLDDAAAADDLRAAGTVLSPMHGVPFTVKDTFNIQGMQTAAGSPAMVGLIAESDALLVDRLKKAGAIAMGKGNCPPMGNGTDDRSIFGVTKNPYNFEASPEGSSVGPAVGISCNFTTVALGSDTTGSLRFPSSANNTVAMKPSKALFSGTGVFPQGFQNAVVGPMTRTVTDLAILFDLLVADYPADITNFEPVFWEAPSSVRPPSYQALLGGAPFAGKRVGLPTPYIGKDFSGSRNVKIGPRMEALVNEARATLESLGAEVVEIEWPVFHVFTRDNEFGVANDIRRFTPAVEVYYFPPPGSPAGTPTYQDRVRVYYYTEFIKTFGNPAIPDFASFGDVIHLTPSNNVTWLNRREQARAGIMEPPTLLLNGSPWQGQLIAGLDAINEQWVARVCREAGVDVVAYPVFNNVAPLPPGESEAEFPTSANFGGDSSLLGIPSIVVPMGYLAQTGVPAGITFLAPQRGRDAELLVYGEAFERATKVRKAPAVTPPLPGETIEFNTVTPPAPRPDTAGPFVNVLAGVKRAGRGFTITGVVRDGSGVASVAVYVNGVKVPANRRTRFQAKVPPGLARRFAGQDLNVLVVVKDSFGNTSVRSRTLRAPRA